MQVICNASCYLCAKNGSRNSWRRLNCNKPNSAHQSPSAISACCAILHEKWDVLNKALTNSPQIQFIYYGALAVTQVYQDRDMLKLHLTGLSAEWLWSLKIVFNWQSGNGSATDSSIVGQHVLYVSKRNLGASLGEMNVLPEPQNDHNMTN